MLIILRTKNEIIIRLSVYENKEFRKKTKQSKKMNQSFVINNIPEIKIY